MKVYILELYKEIDQWILNWQLEGVFRKRDKARKVGLASGLPFRINSYEVS
jgi:hypothetical protein